MNKLFNCLLVVAIITTMSFCISIVQSQDNGYEYVPPAPEVSQVLNGDVNLDGQICMDDPIHIIYHLYRDGRSLPCPETADADRSGAVTITDAVVLLRYIFNGEYLFDCPISCSGTGELYKVD